MRWTWMFVVALAASLVVAPAAHATIFRVTSTDDGVRGCSGTHCPTVRSALAAAKLTAGPDTVLLPDGDLWLDSTLVVDTDVTLEGVSADETYVHGDSEAYRVLEVTANATVTVTRMTLADGYAQGPQPDRQQRSRHRRR
jgi:hypothetical protein